MGVGRSCDHDSPYICIGTRFRGYSIGPSHGQRTRSSYDRDLDAERGFVVRGLISRSPTYSNLHFEIDISTHEYDDAANQGFMNLA